MSLHDITRGCDALNFQQIYRLCTTFWDDAPAPPQHSELQQGEAQSPLPSSTRGLDSPTTSPASTMGPFGLSSDAAAKSVIESPPEGTTEGTSGLETAASSKVSFSAEPMQPLPAPPPDMVSGEVLEDLKRQPQVGIAIMA